MRKFHCSMLVVAFVVLSGCVSVDPKYTEEKTERGDVSLLNGLFSNSRAYGTSRDYGIKKLSWLIHSRSEASVVKVDFRENVGLTLKLMDNDKVVDEGRLEIGKDIFLGKDNDILFKSNQGVPFCDCPAIYYENRQYSMYIDPRGDLVGAERAFSAGLFTIIPAAGVTKEINVFNRIANK